MSFFFFSFFLQKYIWSTLSKKVQNEPWPFGFAVFFFLLSKLGFSSFRSNSFGRTIYEVVLTFHGLFFKCQHKAYVISFLSLCSKCKMLFLWIASGDTDRTGEAKEQLQARSERCNSGKEEVPGDQQRWGFLVSLMFLNRIGFMLMSRSGFFFVCLFSVFLCLVWYVYFYHDLYSVIIFCTVLVCLCVSAEKDRDKAKERYIKASLKLYEVHNEYVLSVQAAQVYHQHHYSQIQPALLSALQTLQQEMVLIL